MDESRVSELRAELAPAVESGTATDEVLWKIKHAGATPMEAIVLMRELFGLSLGEAKSCVTASDAWAPESAAADALHEAALRRKEDE